MEVENAMIISMTMSLGFVLGSRILFVGNSHTQYGDVPGMVQKLLQDEKRFVGVRSYFFAVGLLNQWKGNQSLVTAVEGGGFDYAVLQGAEVSSSHQYTYSQAMGIELAVRLIKAGTRVYLVSEWPRRGWDETDYTEAVYRLMAKESGAQVVRVGRVWDGVRNKLGGIDLWQADGNHALPAGSYLSARVIARSLGGEKLAYVPQGIDRKLIRAVDESYFELPR